MNIQSISFMGTYKNPTNYERTSSNPNMHSTRPAQNYERTRSNPNVHSTRPAQNYETRQARPTSDDYIRCQIVGDKRTKRSLPQYQYPPKDDIIIVGTKQNSQRNRVNHKRKKSVIPLPVKTFAAGVASVLLLNFGTAIAEPTKDVAKVPFDGTPYSLTEIAEQYGCDEDIIRQYNGIKNDEDLNSLPEILVPTKYNYIDDEIEKLQESLYSSKLSAEERNGIEDKISALKDKQAMQQQVAKAYTDGKYIYYIINLTDENGQPFQGGINVETFKDLFDIKDGQIKRYNDLTSVWRKDTDFEEDKGYFDYTGNIFHTGDVIKVSDKGVDTKDIDLEGFIEE